MKNEFAEKLLALVLPIAFRQFMSALVSALDALMLGALSQDALSAVSLAGQIAFVESLFLAALTIGLSMFAAQYWGKGDIPGSERVFAYTMGLVLAVVCGAVSGLALLALTPAILSLTDLSAQAGAYLRGMLVICSYYLIGKSVNNTTISGIFCAGGDSRFGLLCGAVTMWCVTVPLGFLAAFVLRLPVLAVCFVISLDEMVKLPAVYRHYKQYKWVKNLTEKENVQ